MDAPLAATSGETRTLSAWIEGYAATEDLLEKSKAGSIVRRRRGDLESIRLRYFVIRLHRYLSARGITGRRPGTIARFASVALDTKVEASAVLAILRKGDPGG